MNKKIATLQGMTSMEGVWDSTLTPLAPEIWEAKMLCHVIVPKLEKYEGLTDSCDHIQGFKSMMECRGASALIMCKIFPPTLFGPARTWFNRLPRHSVTSFGDLSEKLAVEVAISALVRTVRDEAYVCLVTKKRPKTRGELYARGDKFIQSEDMMKISRFSTSSAPAKKGSSTPRRTERNLPLSNMKQERTEVRSDRRREKQSSKKIDQGPISRYSSYTPLKNSLHNILLKVGNRDIVKWPKKIRALAAKRTSDKCCLFHKDHGHNTEDCRHLKDENESLIRRGYLRQRRRDRSPRHQKGTVGTIGVIVGGLAAGGENSSVKRAYTQINEVEKERKKARRDEDKITFIERDA
ncbi:uncharacterized protein LOC119985528 [Tripterygium wilfordii]|uniref:uncharacterized protein LOC119985528 n=1 Tax=Tripterygium wilfordii TaxID=458696 RepID=UPI0018F7F849|nr:uncharacterized protein LOC119985528 [Tripterygium wilfordii]